MAGSTIHHQCWNHEAREAVCRCPECARPYCRECVTEHDSRLLCAACLQRAAASAAPGRRGGGRGMPALRLFSGLLLAWVFYLALAGGISEFTARMERAAWQNR